MTKRRVPASLHRSSSPSSRYAYRFCSGEAKSSAANSNETTRSRCESTMASVSEIDWRRSVRPSGMGPIGTFSSSSRKSVRTTGGLKVSSRIAAGSKTLKPLTPPKNISPRGFW